METVIAMDKTGRLVLPKSVRRALNIASSAFFQVGTVGNKVELTVLPATSTKLTQNKHGLLVLKRTGQRFDAAEAVAEARGERL